jgi:hypothetical protein
MEKREELQEQHLQLVSRIKHLENDLETPISSSLDDYGQENQSRNITYRLYQIEKENLYQLETEIKRNFNFSTGNRLIS